MKAQIHWVQLVFNFAILGLIGYFIFFKPKEPDTKEYWQNSNFKTDSIRISIDYSKIPKPEYKYQVPPAIVIQYPKQEAPGIHIKADDSLIQVIDSLKHEVFRINALYIKLYPKASKLIYGTFSKDSLSIDLLGTDGRLTTSKLAVNYDGFQYQYKDGGFRAQEFRQNPSNEGLHGILYGYAGYSLTTTSPAIGADYSLYKGKLRAQANSFITIESKPNFYLMGTIGYKLHGK